MRKEYIVVENLREGMAEQFTVLIERGIDGYLIGSVLEIQGCHTQAKTEKELMKRIKEAISLCLEENVPRTRFLGVQRLEVKHENSRVKS